MVSKSGKKRNGKTFKWICAIFLLSGTLVYFPSFTSIIFALLGVALMPVKPIEDFFEKLIPGKKAMKGITAFIIFAFACCIAPQNKSTTPQSTNIPAISTEDMTGSGENLAAQITGESTAALAQESATELTRESVLDLTQDPAAELAQDSVTKSTEKLITESPGGSPAEVVEDSAAETVEDSPAVTGEGSTAEPNAENMEGTAAEPADIHASDGILEVHFIDVGQADAALLLCDGKAMLIDGGNAEDSSLMYSYLKKLNITHLDYVVGTHAHEDHIGGIAGALNFATVDTVYCPVTFCDTEAFNHFLQALDKRNVQITIPQTGNSFNLGGALCTILAVNTDSNEPNNTSIVLRVVYGDTSFLFTGDAEDAVEQEILAGGQNIRSTALKIGHHGSETSTGYTWLRQIMPEYAVISVGKGNTYGYPAEEVLSRLRDAEIKTYRTDMQGDIIMTSDGKTVTVSVEKNADADTLRVVTQEEKLDKIVSDSCRNYNHKSDPLLKGVLSYRILSGSEVELTYDITEQIYVNTEWLVNDAMDEILNYVIADIDRAALPEQVTVSIYANYEITEDNAADVGGEAEETEKPAENNGRDYVVNTNTEKFHYPYCSSVKKIKESNRWDYHGTREKLINMGYVPCKNCNP